MPKDFLPRREADLVTWSGNFAARISAAAESFGLTHAQSESYALDHAALLAAYRTANNPDTRSPTNILLKNEKMNTLTANARMLAGIVQRCPSVTDAQRVDLGLSVRGGGPTPVPAPAEAPGLLVAGVNGRVVTVRLYDAARLTRRGKPANAQHALVLSYVGDEPPEDLGAWRFEASVSKTMLDVVFPTTVAPGSKVFLTAFWINAKSERSAACQAVGTYLQFGGNLRMAA